MPAIYIRNAVQEGQRRRKPSVYAKDCVIHYCSQWQISEDLYDLVPDVVVSVFLHDFIVEAVGAGEGGSLVVASQQYEGTGFEALECQQIANGLDGVVAPVDIVSQKDAFTVRRNCVSKHLLTCLIIFKKS